MAVQVGTYDLASLRANRFQSVAQFGDDAFTEILQTDLAAHRAIMQDMDRDLVAETTDRQRIFGASNDGQFLEVDEYSHVPTQVSVGGSTVGFPLRLYQFGMGWTARHFLKMTVGEAAEKAINAQTANIRKHRVEIRKALYLSSNYTFRDVLDVPVVDLAVKRLANADSMSIPNGPDGVPFNAATHTHYSAAASLTATAFSAAITNVTEHGNGGRIIAAVNYANEAAVRGLTGFIPAPDYRTVPGANSTVAANSTNPANQFDRFIGIFEAAEVWIKPWAVPTYIAVYDAQAAEKPLVRRVDSDANLNGMRVVAEHTVHPLTTSHYEDTFGYAVWGRTSAAILYFGGASYIDPILSE